MDNVLSLMVPLIQIVLIFLRLALGLAERLQIRDCANRWCEHHKDDDRAFNLSLATYFCSCCPDDSLIDQS